MAIEKKIKILGAILELPAKQTADLANLAHIHLIRTYALTFFGYIISDLASVTYK